MLQWVKKLYEMIIIKKVVIGVELNS